MAFQNQKLGKLEYLTAEGIGADHCFSTRFGGVSKGSLSSLNLGIHRGDEPENVLENFRILGQAVGFAPEELVFTRQTHTDIVRQVDAGNMGEGLFRPVEPECDALITNTPGVTLAAFTADCTPILLCDPVTGAVGAVHAGWRGTVPDIAGKTVDAMVRAFGCEPADICAAIGPNIGACCFETDRDVPDAVLAVLGEAGAGFIRSNGSKYHVDLKGVNEALLRRAGVERIDVSTECTACRPDRFWSHRVTRGDRGAQAAIIRCRGGQKI
jgi:YfiH family protein